MTRRITVVRFALFLVLLALPTAGAVLTVLQLFQQGLDGVEGIAQASHVVASPDGMHVYVAGAGSNAITVFARDATNESLTYAGMVEDGVGGVFGLAGVAGLATSPDGRHLLAVAPDDDSLTMFARDASHDTLALVDVQVDNIGPVFGLTGARAVTLSPDGSLVYVAAELADGVVVFARDASQDQLALRQVLRDPGSGEGLRGPRAIAASPDGFHVYLAATGENALTVLRRTGSSLAIAAVYRDGENGMNALAGISSLAVTPDGRHVIVTAALDNAVTVLARSGDTLAHVATYRDGVNGIDGLVGATSVVVASSAPLVVVACAVDNRVTLFRREPESGLLTNLAAVNAPPGIMGLERLALGPDDRSLYAVSSVSDAIVAYRLPLIFGDGFELGTFSRWM